MLRIASALVVLMSPLIAAAQAVKSHGEDVPVDFPPNPLADLVIDIDELPTDYSISLTWTAPSDNPGGIIIGIPVGADTYEVRRSTDGPIVDETSWLNATPCPEGSGMVPAMVGEAEFLTIGGLDPGTRYWFSIKSRGAATQLWSDVSYDSPDAQTSGSAPTPTPSPSPSPIAMVGAGGGEENETKCGGSAGSVAGLILAGMIPLLLISRR